MVTAPQPTQLTDILGALRRHWTVIAAAAIIGLLLGVVASFLIPASYTATSVVSVSPMTADPLAASVDLSRSVNMPTEQELVTSRTVAAEAADILGPDESLSAEDVLSAVTATTPEDSLVLNISFAGDSPEQAAAGADAVAEAYLTTRRDTASEQVDRMVEAASQQIADVEEQAAASESEFDQRSLGIQADALGSTLAELRNVDLQPGQVIGQADEPAERSTPGLVPLGVAGLFLGLLVGIPLALVRKDEDTEIGGVDGLSAIGDQIVLDGTKDTNRADTWDIAAFMLKIPIEIGIEDPFTIMVDAEDDPARAITPGQELVDALSRRGRSARFVDAGAINEGKISRGWPTDRKRESWAGEIVIIDTTHLASDANKVALATRSDSVLLARSTADDATALRRLAGLLRSKNVDIALTALFPPRAELLHHTR